MDTNDTILAQRLRFAVQGAKDAHEKYMLACDRRKDAIDAAVKAGWTYRRIGEAAGVSYQRIHQVYGKVPRVPA